MAQDSRLIPRDERGHHTPHRQALEFLEPHVLLDAGGLQQGGGGPWVEDVVEELGAL